MRIIDDALLRSFRGRPCEVCRSTHGTVAHHIYHRSAGRMDVGPNLIALCFFHHADHHAGRHPDKLTCLRKVARRHRTTVARVVAVLDRLRAADKDADVGPILEGLRNGTDATRPRDGRTDPVDPAGRDEGGGGAVLRHPDMGPPGDSGAGVPAPQDGWNYF